MTLEEYAAMREHRWGYMMWRDKGGVVRVRLCSEGEE